MRKFLYILPLVFVISVLLGCSTLFVPQELSGNYALEPGVICDAPRAVDGNLSTTSDNTRILISLPEKKSIRRIIIHSPNIANFIIYESIGGEGQWRVIRSIKGNRLTRIEIDTQVTTDKIRMFVTDTTDNRYADPGSLKDVDGNANLFSRLVDARPQIQEIELYGFVDKPKTEEREPLKPLF